MSNQYSADVPKGFSVPKQVRLDYKTGIQNEETLKDLGVNNNLAFTYYEGLEVYCKDEKTKYVWREVSGIETGLLDSHFEYPTYNPIDGIDYSGKLFNFFQIINSNNPLPDGSETKIEAGDNIIVEGTGTILDPYIINSTSEISETIIEAGDNINITGDGSLLNPYIINADAEDVGLVKTELNEIIAPTQTLSIINSEATGKVLVTKEYVQSIIPTTPDGSETKIIEGDNITISGIGTVIDPYVINTDIPPSDSVYIFSGDDINVTGTGTVEDPFYINATGLDLKLDKNPEITPGSFTKITYDANGLVTSGEIATTVDIDDSFDRRYVTDVDLDKLSVLSGINTGNETTESIQTKRPLKTIEGNSLEGIGDIQLTTTNISEGTNLYYTDGRFDSRLALTVAGGELSGTYPNPTLSNNAVISKTLTGLNIIGSTINSSDSILTAFGKLQNQFNSVIGSSIYQGVWNATTNTPTLTSSIGTKGYYYKVSIAGSTNLDGIIDWNIGDWVIFNGTTWDKVDNTDSVSSVNGFTGSVNITKSDIGLYNVDNTSDLNKPVSTATQIAIDAKVSDFINDGVTTIAPSQNTVYDALQLKKNATSTAITSALTITNNTTTFSVSAFTGKIVDNSTVPATITDINFAGASNITPLYFRTLLYVDNTGTLQQFNGATSDLSPLQRVDNIFIGIVVYSGGTIQVIQTIPDIEYSTDNRLAILGNYIKNINDGNNIGANGANLQVNKGAGSTWRLGSNFATNRKVPDVTTDTAATPIPAGVNLIGYRNGSGGWTYEAFSGSITPQFWDNGTGVKATVSNNKFTNQRVYFFNGTNTYVIYLGRTEYSTITAAQTAAQMPDAIVDPATSPASLIGVISVEKSCTALNNASLAAFTQGPRMQGGASSGGASGSQNLQNTYLNSSVPQITTTALGAFTVEEGTGNDANNVLQGKNGVGTTTFSVTGAGNITGGTYNGYVPLSGTLTTNVIPKATGTNSLGDSSISDTGTAVTVLVSDQAGVNINNETATASIMYNTNYINASTGGGGYVNGMARGTIASPLTVQNNDRLGFTLYRGWNGSSWINSAGIDAFVSNTGTVSSTSMPTFFRFLTTPNGSNTRVERMRIDSDGSILIGTNVNNGNRLNLNGTAYLGSTVTVAITPTTSAGSYDILTRNTSTGVVEKVESNIYAPVASPALTGTPTAPTATAGTNTTQIATTAFVQAANSGTLQTTGNQSFTGTKTGTSTNSTPARIVMIDNNTASNPVISVINNNTATGAFGIIAINSATASTNATSGIYAYNLNTGGNTSSVGVENSSTGKGLFVKNLSTGIGNNFENWSSGNMTEYNTQSGATGNHVVFKKVSSQVAKIDVNGNATFQKYNLNTGSNASAGNATLVAGTVTVTTTAATANSLIMLTRKTAGGTTGEITYTTSAGSFTITSQNAADTSTITYLIIN